MRASKKFSPELVEKIRQFPLFSTMDFLNLYWKIDPTFLPVKDLKTKLVHVSFEDKIFSLLITDTKWFDTISGSGGGGAIDLTMHLLDVEFVTAVNLLSKSFVRRTP